MVVDINKEKSEGPSTDPGGIPYFIGEWEEK